MADIAQALATYEALVGVAVGAGLTYLFGTLNRRHQEKREKETRWYDKRLQAYVEFYQSVYEAFFRMGANARKKMRLSDEEIESLLQRLLNLGISCAQPVGGDACRIQRQARRRRPV